MAEEYEMPETQDEKHYLIIAYREQSIDWIDVRPTLAVPINQPIRCKVYQTKEQADAVAARLARWCGLMKNFDPFPHLPKNSAPCNPDESDSEGE